MDRIVKLANEIQDFCIDSGCDNCIFAIPNGHCELNHPHMWDLEGLGVEEDV